MRRFGIYIAYAPTIDLRAEGLGRHLASFLKGAGVREDVRFVVACPSWSREAIYALCKSEGVDPASFDLVSPSGKPAALHIYEALLTWRRRQRGGGGRFLRFLAAARNLAQKHKAWVERRLAVARNLPTLFVLSLYLLVAALFALPFAAAAYLWKVWTTVRPRAARYFERVQAADARIQRLRAMMSSPKSVPFSYRLFRFMESRESALLIELINALEGVAAWYSPAAFWPAFNDIRAPRLMCVPDVVLTEFPVGYSGIAGDRFLDKFDDVEMAIRGCDHFITYSEQVKWDTLVDRYDVSPDAVRVVHHAPNLLDEWISVSGFDDKAAATRNYCEYLFERALFKATNIGYTNSFENRGARFIFYASQFRPNKNVLNLLRAYEFLLRSRYLPHKLVLTGDPDVLPEIADFVAERNLGKDVLFLRRLNLPELAACYRLAELAVNPSLSEGGCPFTFTEALSVGTPVVMAQIPVTLEILNDPALTEAMLFDPLDWRDMARRITWALENRETLLALQTPAYARLAERTWNDVANEYIGILESISMRPSLQEPSA